MEADQYGEARCGVGQCVMDGEPLCSAPPVHEGQRATMDVAGVAICDAGLQTRQWHSLLVGTPVEKTGPHAAAILNEAVEYGRSKTGLRARPDRPVDDQ